MTSEHRKSNIAIYGRVSRTARTRVHRVGAVDGGSAHDIAGLSGNGPLEHVTSIESPVGPILLVTKGSALAGVYTKEHRRWKRFADIPARWDAISKAAAEQLKEYFAGRRESFDLPLAPEGTAFQQRVWQQLQRIPFGERCSYQDIARRLGMPKGARAVGSANARNPISIVIPCHRVVGSKGSLTGYAGGLSTKNWLLEHEENAVGQNSDASRIVTGGDTQRAGASRDSR
ncbi:MAG: methylated-DNA--[protein]-cysteine S-methyltransferase [Planctomycetota bacterium]